MRAALWLMAAALPLAAQPKLLVNAQTGYPVRGGRTGADAPAPDRRARPAWIGYSVPSVRAFLGCDYVRDGWNQPGVIHLEPPDHAVVLFRVEGGEVLRIRTLSPGLRDRCRRPARTLAQRRQTARKRRAAAVASRKSATATATAP